MKKKGRFKIRYVISGILIAAILLSMVFMRLGGLSTGDAANAEEFRKYAEPVENLSIPGDKKIIALGEATHGNAEFQQLKLEVFKPVYPRRRGDGRAGCGGDRVCHLPHE